MSKTETLHPYYSFDRIFSYNAVYNFVQGGRGLGKTYGAKKKAIRAALKNGEQFIYLRRYKTELDSRHTFFADISHEFPEWDFRINGHNAEYAPIESRDDKKRIWHVMGYFISLSTAQTKKSVAYPLVTLIIFDEYIIEKGALHYLPDEANVFNNFYSTVDRWKDKTRVLFLANSVSIMNPYFLEYNIKPEDGREFSVLYDGFVACHFADSDEFASSVYGTRFGQFIKGTAYADYSIGNKFKDNNDRLLMFKGATARYKYTVQTRRGTFSVWVDHDEGKFYMQAKLPKEQTIYVTEPELMEHGKKYIQYSHGLLQVLRSAFMRGTLYFDTAQTRNAVVEIFKR